MAQSVGRLIEEQEVPGLILSLAHTFVDTDHEIFSSLIFPCPLIQKGQLSVTGESMDS